MMIVKFREKDARKLHNKIKKMREEIEEVEEIIEECMNHENPAYRYDDDDYDDDDNDMRRSERVNNTRYRRMRR